MGRPRTITDEEILKGARVCFLEHGPSVSTTVIAATLGISQAALFKRFGSKQKLMIAALVRLETPSWFAMLDEEPEAKDLREQLWHLACAMWQSIEEVAPSISVLRASGIDPHELFKAHEVPPPVMGQRALAAWLRRAQQANLTRAIDPEHVALAFLGAMHSHAFFKHALGDKDDATSDDAYLRSLVDLIWSGLEP